MSDAVAVACCRPAPRVRELEHIAREWTALAAEHGLVIVGGLCEDDGSIVDNSSVSSIRAVALANRRPELYA
jgi:hypothetical protein